MKRALPTISAALLVFATALWLFFWRAKLGRDNWFLAPNPVAWPLGAWLLPLGVLLIFGGFAAVSAYDRFVRAKTEKIARTSTRLARVGIFILALAWPWSLLGPTPIGTNGAANLIQATWSDISNGYFSAAYDVSDAREFSRTYADKRQQATSPNQAHVATHPPGAVLFYYFARRTYEALPPLQNFCSALARFLTNETDEKLSDDSRAIVRAATGVTPTLPASAAGSALWCAFLSSLILASATVAVFGLAHRTVDFGRTSKTDEANAGRREADARGLFAASLLALAPMCGLFTFSLDAVIAAGAAWILFCLSRANTKSTLVAGALLGAVSFLSFGALAIGVVAAFTLALQKRPRDIMFLGAGFVAAWVVIWLVFPHDVPRVFSQAMAAHRAATLTSRAHLPWSALNILFFALFVGWPLVVAVVRAPRAVSFGLAALATALLLTLSGNVRGEVERLWLFLLPAFAAWAGTAELGRFRPYFVALQAAQSLIMAATLAPLVRP
ncbi:MAG TPA: hypothetical protein VF681_15100 [Abditibacteriaceae bacterium]|jgi:hypothetical protein